MAIVDLSGGFGFPPPPVEQPNASVAPATSAISLDAANDKSGTIFEVPQSGTIVGGAFATLTTTTGATVDVRLETVSSGLPSGTLAGTNTNASVVIANGDDNVIKTYTLTGSLSVTMGDQLAHVIVNPAGSPGNLQIAHANIRTMYPYGAQDQGSWAKISGASFGVQAFALEYSGGIWVPIDGVWPPIPSFSTNDLSTSTTPDVDGLLFQIPVSVRARGAWVWMDGDGDVSIKLVTTAYNQGAGTGILASSRTLTANERPTNAPGIYWVPFTARVTLAANTEYRLINEPTTTTARRSYHHTLSSTAMMGALPGGTSWVRTTAKDPTQDSDWTDTTTARTMMGLWIDGIEAGSGGAVGSLIYGGLAR